MATSTTTTSSAEVITEFSKQILNSPSNNIVFSQFAHRDTTNSTSKEYSFETELGISGSGVEGTDATPGAAVPVSTSLVVTCSEGVVDMRKFTDREISANKFNQIQAAILSGAIQNEDVPVLLGALRRNLTRMLKAGRNKIEKDLLSTISGCSTVIDNAGNAFTLANMRAAVAKARTNNMTCQQDQLFFMLTPKQAEDIEAELDTSTGLSHLWTTQYTSTIGTRQENQAAKSGFLGWFKGFPVYMYDQAFLVLSGAADAYGFFGAAGDIAMNPTEADNVERMGFANILYRNHLNFGFSKSADTRALNATLKADYVAHEVQDVNGIALISLK